MTSAMTTQTRLICLHDSRACCALCSDQDPRWRGWRVGLGVGEEPPNVRTESFEAPRSTRKPWTPEDDDLLLAGELGIDELCSLLERTSGAIYKRRHVLKHEGRPASPKTPAMPALQTIEDWQAWYRANFMQAVPA